ncbi:hypothetical protein FQR65_LT03757 [Abscondita terminalis]|nr:hypothetical protein FQR65_LT03757 [Abscondita terminalis]
MALICYTDNPDPNGKPIIAGIHATYPKTKWDPKYQLPDETASIIFGIVSIVDLTHDFQFLKTDVLLCAMGLYVPSTFRGHNVGLELLMAREKLGKAVGIKASVSVVTASVSQILAERAGFKVLPGMPFEDLQTPDQKFIFPEIGEHTTGIKHMYKEF